MINENGFLSNEIEILKLKNKDNNLELFQLCEDLNKISHVIMFEIKIDQDKLVELLSACTLVRSISSFQGVIILCEYGLVNEAKIILRSFVEAMFLMVAINKDHDFAYKILDQDVIEQKRASNAIRRNIINGIHKLESPTIKEIDNKIKSLNKTIKDKGIEKLYKSDLAKAADMTSYYDTVYHVLSGSVHINPRDLEQYLELDKENNVKQINWVPDLDEIEHVLFVALESQIFVLRCVSNLYGVDLGEQFGELNKKYMAIGEKI